MTTKAAAQSTNTTTLSLDDQAEVTFGTPVLGGISFHDVGFMPITGIDGHAGGAGGGLFLKYTADGVQHFDAAGNPTAADYNSMHFEIDAYIGKLTFGHAADGSPTETGSALIVKIATGDLLSGHLAFGPTGNITGEVDASLKALNGTVIGALDIHVAHAPGDIGPALGGMTLSGGTTTADLIALSQHNIA